jgi:hypothetical protein
MLRLFEWLRNVFQRKPPSGTAGVRYDQHVLYRLHLPAQRATGQPAPLKWPVPA